MPIDKRSDPPDVLVPYPDYLETHRTTVNNFGLYFQKFCRYQKELPRGASPDMVTLKSQHSWNNGQKGGNRRDYEWSILDNQLANYDLAKMPCQPLLDKVHERQTLCLEGLVGLGSGILEITGISATPLLTGIGETSPTEVGMKFDRNLGIPFLPASSIKGAVRYAYCVNYALANESAVGADGTLEEKDIPGLIALFGDTNTADGSRGGFAFMDGYAAKVPELVIDIMNPHHGGYYQNTTPGQGPIETESPIPIKFLSVKKGGEYKFRGFFLTKEAEAHRAKLIEAFRTALTLLGLGAKTAVGYGRFDSIQVEKTGEIKNRAKEIKKSQARLKKKEQEKKEAERKAAEEQAEKERKQAEKEAQKIQREAEAEEIERLINETPPGIDKEILIIEHQKKGDEQYAIECYDTYLQSLKSLSDQERELALLVKIGFKKYTKKTKKIN